MIDQAHEDVAQLLCGDRAWKLGHGGAVAFHAARIATAIGLDRQATSRVRLAACLHDIGKSLIDEHTLRKAGPLDVDEWAQIRLHPVLGEQILIGEGLTEIAPWVRAHHERCDGLGYPDGLAGTAIPLGARIIAVADAYDAMVSGRPHSEPINRADACNELRRERGSQFDAEVVTAFLRCLQEGARPAAPIRAGRTRLTLV